LDQNAEVISYLPNLVNNRWKISLKSASAQPIKESSFVQLRFFATSSKRKVLTQTQRSNSLAKIETSKNTFETFEEEKKLTSQKLHKDKVENKSFSNCAKTKKSIFYFSI